MKRVIALFTTAILIGFFVSCDKGSGGRRTLLPNVTGAAGEVVVVLDRALHKDDIGLAYREILQEEYPMIPQSEPLFNVVMIPHTGFGDIFKSHRNIVITKVSSEYEKAQIVPQRDVWAAPQTVLNIIGPTYPAIEKMLKEEKDRLVQLLEQAERDRIVNNAIRFEAEGIRSRLNRKFNISMYFPRGYKILLDTTDFVWIGYETPSTTQGIFIYQYPYKDANTFTGDYLVERRNEFTKKFVPGPSTGSYMITVTEIPPRFQPLMYKGRYFGQLRGLWDVYRHPMGGPFISLTTIDEERNMVITAEGFVFSPRLNKRNFTRQVEALLYTLTVEKKKPEDE